MQTVKTLNLRPHCLLRPVCPNTWGSIWVYIVCSSLSVQLLQANCKQHTLILMYLIWVYTNCSGLSVPIHRVSSRQVTNNADPDQMPPSRSMSVRTIRTARNMRKTPIMTCYCLDGLRHAYPLTICLWRLSVQSLNLSSVLGPSAYLFIAQFKEQLHRSTPWQFSLKQKYNLLYTSSLPYLHVCEHTSWIVYQLSVLSSSSLKKYLLSLSITCIEAVPGERAFITGKSDFQDERGRVNGEEK